MFHPAQEYSPTRVPNIPKAPKSSTGCSGLSVLRLSEGPLETEQSHSCAWQPGQKIRGWPWRNILLLWPHTSGTGEDERLLPGEPAQLEPPQGQTGEDGAGAALSEPLQDFFWMKCSSTEQICQ